jgi:UDP-GlcNAc:undecaprenyl-phosphate GlcNAc-1-phosphate transferase
LLLNGKDISLAFTSSFILAILLTPIMRRLALKIELVDRPNQAHKTHVRPVPYLGGLAIVIGVVTVTFGSLILTNSSLQILFLAATILLPALIMSVIGLIDDMRQLPPFPRFLAQNLIAFVAALILSLTKTIGTPTENAVLDFAITMFWLVGITNSINFFDNIDGGASGTVAIISIALTCIAFFNGQYLIAAMASVLAGAVTGFLIWNKPPARIYMGDAGALFLGILVASLSIRLDTKSYMDKFGLLVPALLLAVPILDTSVAVIKRVVRRVSPFQGGRDHLSHRLMRLGMNRKEAVVTLWSLTMFFASAAVMGHVSFLSFGREIMIICLLAWLILFIFFFLQDDD